MSLQPGVSSGCVLLQARVGKTQEQHMILLQVKTAVFPCCLEIQASAPNQAPRSAWPARPVPAECCGRPFRFVSQRLYLQTWTTAMRSCVLRSWSGCGGCVTALAFRCAQPCVAGLACH